MVTWTTLINRLTIKHSEILSLNCESDIYEYSRGNLELNDWIIQVSNGKWRCLAKHEARVFLIKTPFNRSMVWISWVGNRGCRWHVVKIFPLDGGVATQTIRNLAKILVYEYQNKWNQNVLDIKVLAI